MGTSRPSRRRFELLCGPGLGRLHQGVKSFQTKHGHDWVKLFVPFYLGTKRTCAMTETCAPPTLSPEIECSDGKARTLYDAEMLALVTTIANGFTLGPEPERLKRA